MPAFLLLLCLAPSDVAPFGPPKWAPLFAGVELADLKADRPRPMRGHAVRIDLRADGVSFLATPPNGDRPGETDGLKTSTFLAKHRCQLAINAAPFAPIHKVEGQPQTIEGLTPLAGTGLRWIPVVHADNAVESSEEAAVLRDLITAALEGGACWTDMDDRTVPLDLADVLVVAPYNLQVRVIRRRLADAGFDETRVGTVDRFQGQEAPAVIMSMTSSSTVDLPRGLDFLLSRNRLNVALSRAQALAVMICSPRLLDADVRGVDQMRLVAGMLGLLEKVKKFPS